MDFLTKKRTETFICRIHEKWRIFLWIEIASDFETLGLKQRFQPFSSCGMTSERSMNSRQNLINLTVKLAYNNFMDPGKKNEWISWFCGTKIEKHFTALAP